MNPSPPPSSSVYQKNTHFESLHNRANCMQKSYIRVQNCWPNQIKCAIDAQDWSHALSTTRNLYVCQAKNLLLAHTLTYHRLIPNIFSFICLLLAILLALPRHLCAASFSLSSCFRIVLYGPKLWHLMHVMYINLVVLSGSHPFSGCAIQCRCFRFWTWLNKTFWQYFNFSCSPSLHFVSWKNCCWE